MVNTKVEMQATLYVFDLDNSAKEYWFKPTEGWELSLTSDEGRSVLERKYRPVHSTKALPETLVQLLGLVKSKLLQSGQSIDQKPGSNTAASVDMQYLVAYNPTRLR